MAFTRFIGPTQNVTASNTDAWFRQLGLFSDGLTAVGLPKTSDTGQVDWTTVTLPTASTYTNYEIRRFADTEQATDPIFFKLSYGFVNVSTSSFPQVRITVGTGSDGAGNLTGASTTTLINTLSQSATARAWLLSSDLGGFACLPGVSNQIARLFFSLERARDVDGATIPGQVLYTYSDPSPVASIPLPSPGAGVIDLVAGNTYASNTIPVYYWKSLAAATDSLVYSDTYPFGILSVPTTYGIARSKLWVGAARADFTDQALIPVPRFSGGTEIRYLMEVKEANTVAGDFGPTPSGAGTTLTNTPSAHAFPMIYWQ